MFFFIAYAGFPLTVNRREEVSGNIVKIMWEKASRCPANITVTYTVYYREVLRTGSRGKWNAVSVLKGATQYDLQLKCFKEYEIAVTNTKRALPRKRWKVKTGVGRC